MKVNDNDMYILGISAYYHDSAAALIRSGEVLCAAQEERFSRIRHDAAFPIHSILYCLEEAGISLKQVHAIVFYDKPLVKFERIFETYMTHAPKGFRSFFMAMPIWLKEKLFLRSTLKQEFSQHFNVSKGELPSFWFTEHHQAHAASAFFPSPFPSAAVLCLDGVGEWATSSLWVGSGNQLDLQWEIQFPHSLGLLYSAFTYYTGFKVNSGEYKLMGLAPYGEPKYVQMIYDHLIDVKPDGTFRLNLEYFDFMVGLRMTNSKFNRLFGSAPRKPNEPLTQREMDIARSIQVVTEDIVLKLANTAYSETGMKNLCLAGGVALNCVANGRITRESKFENIWIQPAAGDAGGALGAALAGWYQKLNNKRVAAPEDSMKGSYLGPKFSSEQIRQYLQEIGADFKELREKDLYETLVEKISAGAVVGWFQGRMEFGPRALGARSIIGDARNPQMQSTMNLKIKFRESFRPFAPAILEERVGEFFEHKKTSPYMLIVAPLREEHKVSVASRDEDLFGIEKLKVVRSKFPAITHVDFSARIQSVNQRSNPKFYALLKAFESKTGSPILVNTSFNVRGEPIVCTPKDAFRCFMRTEIDYLVMENFLIEKKSQPASLKEGDQWKTEFALD